MEPFFKSLGDDFISAETEMLRYVAKNSSERSEFDWIVSWNCYVMLAVFSGRQPQMASALPGNLIAEDF